MTKEIKKFGFRCVNCQGFTVSKVYEKPLTRSVLQNSVHGWCTGCEKKVRVIYDHFVQSAHPLDTK